MITAFALIDFRQLEFSFEVLLLSVLFFTLVSKKTNDMVYTVLEQIKNIQIKMILKATVHFKYCSKYE